MKQSNYWVFQGNPKIYNIISALNNNAVTTWSIKSHLDKIKSGDKIILWVTGDKQGCYALGEIISDVYIGLDEENQMKYYTKKSINENANRVKINITHNLSNKPITKKQINEYKALSKLKVGNQGTNFSATENEYNILLNIAQNMNQKKYWLYAPGKNGSLWDEFYNEGIMAIGWDKLDDLKNYDSKEDIRKKLQETENTDSNKKNDTRTIFEFKEVISIGDIVITKKGKKEYLGYGVVTSDYFFDPNRKAYQNYRKVDWKKKGVWEKEDELIPMKTLTDISGNKDYINKLIELIGIEDNKNIKTNEVDMSHPLNVILYGPPGTGKTYNTILRAAEIIEERKISDYEEAKKIFKANLHDRIEFITFHQNYSYEDFIQGLRPEVDNKTSLTFDKKDGVFKKIADRAYANILLSKKAPEEISKETQFEIALDKFSDIVNDSSDKYKINDAADIIQVEEDAFRYTGKNWTNHPGLRMKFSDLKEFYRNDVKVRKDIKNLKTISGLANQHATYYLIIYNKILEQLPKKIEAPKKIEERNYVIVIDEINRANISRVFGELITLIEPDKRSGGEISLEAKLPSGDIFIVPSNLYIIGTMNTADKSIALLDIALRRRFEFESMYPKYEIEGNEIYDVDILKNINEQIIKSKGHDFQIGHSYFMNKNEDLLNRMNKKVIPLLLEYYMNDKKEVEKILTNAGLKLKENSWPIEITGRS